MKELRKERGGEEGRKKTIKKEEGREKRNGNKEAKL